MSDPALRQMISKHQLQSVINLRGASTHEQWYLDEIAVCHETGTKHYDVAMSATSTPEEATIQELVRILRTAPKPMLVHCKNGADRTGLACAFWLVISGKANPDQALRRGLTAWHGHMPIGPTAVMDRVFISHIQSNPDVNIEEDPLTTPSPH